MRVKMGKREQLSKKIRFEVFKRDKFTCQYCGRMAPDVILEVDHIKPVAEGGKNEIINLITSCRDCNRGKGKTLLSKNEEVKKQQKQIQELAEKREQLEMLFEWKNKLAEYDNNLVENLNNYLERVSGYGCTDYGKSKLKNLMYRFSFPEVMEAIEISYSTYYENNEKSWNYAFDKIGGVCYNRRKQGQV